MSPVVAWSCLIMLTALEIVCAQSSIRDITREIGGRISRACVGSTINSFHVLQCAPREAILILRVLYGAKRSGNCPLEASSATPNHCCAAQNGDCLIEENPSRVSAMRSQCEGHDQCMFQASIQEIVNQCDGNSLFRWTTYMQVHYECIAEIVDDVKTNSACYGSNLASFNELECQPPNTILLLQLSYGVKANGTSDCPYVASTNTSTDCCRYTDRDCVLSKSPFNTTVQNDCNYLDKCKSQGDLIDTSNRCPMVTQFRYTTYRIVRYACVRPHPTTTTTYTSTTSTIYTTTNIQTSRTNLPPLESTSPTLISATQSSTDRTRTPLTSSRTTLTTDRPSTRAPSSSLPTDAPRRSTEFISNTPIPSATSATQAPTDSSSTPLSTRRIPPQTRTQSPPTRIPPRTSTTLSVTHTPSTSPKTTSVTDPTFPLTETTSETDATTSTKDILNTGPRSSTTKRIPPRTTSTSSPITQTPSRTTKPSSHQTTPLETDRPPTTRITHLTGDVSRPLNQTQPPTSVPSTIPPVTMTPRTVAPQTPTSTFVTDPPFTTTEIRTSAQTLTSSPPSRVTSSRPTTARTPRITILNTDAPVSSTLARTQTQPSSSQTVQPTSFSSPIPSLRTQQPPSSVQTPTITQRISRIPSSPTQPTHQSSTHFPTQRRSSFRTLRSSLTTHTPSPTNTQAQQNQTLAPHAQTSSPPPVPEVTTQLQTSRERTTTNTASTPNIGQVAEKDDTGDISTAAALGIGIGTGLMALLVIVVACIICYVGFRTHRTIYDPMNTSGSSAFSLEDAKTDSPYYFYNVGPGNYSVA